MNFANRLLLLLNVSFDKKNKNKLRKRSYLKRKSFIAKISKKSYFITVTDFKL